MVAGSRPIITLTTDFGEDSPYAAAMKGVILSINPAAQIVDLSHQIPPQDLVHAAFFLAESIPYFPAQAIHVVVVDPGVGTSRNLLYVETDSHRLLVPDNGVWTLLARDRVVGEVQRLTDRRYWRPDVCSTFHGRDILAPVAGHLSLGLNPALLGPPANAWIELPIPKATRTGDSIIGKVIFVDHFGNLITNIPGSQLPREPFQVMIENQLARWVRTYGDAAAGELVALISSGGWLEIAVVQGNASKQLGVSKGTPVFLKLLIKANLGGP